MYVMRARFLSRLACLFSTTLSAGVQSHQGRRRDSRQRHHYQEVRVDFTQ